MAEVIYGIQMWNEEENWWTPPRIPLSRPELSYSFNRPPSPRTSWNENLWFGAEAGTLAEIMWQSAVTDCWMFSSEGEPWIR